MISLEELVGARIERRATPPPRCVVLTFDDGYADDVELALPALERHGSAAAPSSSSALPDGVSARARKARNSSGRALMTPRGNFRNITGRLCVSRAVTRVRASASCRVSLRLSSARGPRVQEQLCGATLATRRADVRLAIEQSRNFFFCRTSRRLFPRCRCCLTVRCRVSIRGRKPPEARACLALRRFKVRGTDSLLRFALTLWLGDLRALRRRDRGCLVRPVSQCEAGQEESPSDPGRQSRKLSTTDPTCRMRASSSGVRLAPDSCQKAAQT